jgi:hypothetical protein
MAEIGKWFVGALVVFLAIGITLEGGLAIDAVVVAIGRAMLIATAAGAMVHYRATRRTPVVASILVIVVVATFVLAGLASSLA